MLKRNADYHSKLTFDGFVKVDLSDLDKHSALPLSSLKDVDSIANKLSEDLKALQTRNGDVQDQLAELQSAMMKGKPVLAAKIFADITYSRAAERSGGQTPESKSGPIVFECRRSQRPGPTTGRSSKRHPSHRSGASISLFLYPVTHGSIVG